MKINRNTTNAYACYETNNTIYIEQVLHTFPLKIAL